jgi:flagellar hook-associated protein 2
LHLITDSIDTTVGGNPAQVISGSTAYQVKLDADDTLADLATKLNNLGAGITASVVSDSSGTLRHRLSLNSNIAGRAGDLLVDGSAQGLKFQTLTTAQDALLGIGNAAGGRVVSSATNVFQDAIEGLNVTLNGSSAETVTVSATSTSSDIESAVQLFVDQYNKLRDKLASYTFFNESDNSKGTLFGSSEVLRLDSEVSRAVTQQYFATGSIRSFNELGISADDKGKLTFDKTRLQQRFVSDPEGLQEFFADETKGFATQVDKVLERLVGRNNSALVNRASTLQKQIEDATSRVNTLSASLERQRERLQNQFYNMELAISKIKSSLSSIESIQFIGPGST